MNYNKINAGVDLAAHIGRGKKVRLYARIELDAAAKVFKAMNCPKAMVYLWLVCQARATGYSCIKVTNTAMAKYGVSREIKRRALAELEAAGIISVTRDGPKNPTVTLLCG